MKEDRAKKNAKVNNMKKVLVTGGCGYIGSHTIIDLIENGFEVISVDNHINSNRKPLSGIRKITGKTIKNYKVDLSDKTRTRKIFAEHPDIVGIVHFAALKSVGDSVRDPLLYFRNNMLSTLNLLECSHEFGVKHFIFSSSCSVYGNSTELPVTEATPLQEAESPYARTKQMGEQMIHDAALEIKGTNFILLRYFNPCGAHESAIIGESPTTKAQNLVPVITETAIGKRDSMTVFGDDYDTRDGSCIRDYIHVMDLADAHTKALQYLIKDKNNDQVEVFNLGIGDGVSVLEAIRAFESSTGKKLNYKIGPRRAGDVVAIYANFDAANQKLGWSPQRDINDIMKTAWAWEVKRS